MQKKIKEKQKHVFANLYNSSQKLQNAILANSVHISDRDFLYLVKRADETQKKIQKMRQKMR